MPLPPAPAARLRRQVRGRDVARPPSGWRIRAARLQRRDGDAKNASGCFIYSTGHHIAGGGTPPSRLARSPALTITDTPRSRRAWASSTFSLSATCSPAPTAGSSQNESQTRSRLPTSDGFAQDAHCGLGRAVHHNEPYYIARSGTPPRSTTSATAAPAERHSHREQGRRGAIIWVPEEPYGEEPAIRAGARTRQICTALWEGWTTTHSRWTGSVAGRFADPGKIHPIVHQRRVPSRSPVLDLPRPVQGWPALVQAGGSPSAVEFAAMMGEVIFAAQGQLEEARAFRGACTWTCPNTAARRKS